MTHKLGKLAPVFPASIGHLGDYAAAPLPAPPSWVNWERFMPESPDNWPVDGNDRYGDCVMAAIAHQMQSWNHQTGVADPIPTQQQVIDEYFTLTGGKDNGLVISSTLRTWQTSGLWGNKIAAYARVGVTNKTELKQAIAFYGGVILGMNLPKNADTQFDNGQPWSLVPGYQNVPLVGGHAVPVLAYNDVRMYGITWGRVQPISWDWYFHYGDEAWVCLSEEFVQAGHANGLDAAQLQADIASV